MGHLRSSIRAAYGALWTLIEIGMVLMCTTMVVAVFLQVIFRYLLQAPLSWSEELGRYMFTWVVMLGCAVAIRRESHFTLRLLVDQLPSRSRVPIELLGNASVLALLVMMTWKGMEWAVRFSDQVSPAMQIRLSYVVVAVPVACFIMSVEVLLQCVRILRRSAQPAELGSGGRSVQ